MNYPWLNDYCLGRPGANKDYKAEWQATRYLLADKMFAMVGENKEGDPIVTLKLEPNHGVPLREQFADVSPGYYMNKDHWNSVKLRGTVPDGVLQDMIDRSHALILASLPKKKQQELVGS